MSSGFKSEKIINIDNSVAVRKVYFNEEGLEMVGKVRGFLEDRYYDKTREDVKFSLPATLHLVLSEYIELMEAKGHQISKSDYSQDVE